MGPSNQGRTRAETVREKMLKSVFGPEIEEVTRGWRKLPDKELHGLYSSPNIIKVNFTIEAQRESRSMALFFL
jgi:hypothetical protein